jgi:hypothetical protein
MHLYILFGTYIGSMSVVLLCKDCVRVTFHNPEMGSVEHKFKSPLRTQ